MLALALALLALAANAKPTVVRVRAGDGAMKRVAFDEGAAPTVADLCASAECGELFLDEACAEPCVMGATLASLDIAHGSVVYAPLAETPERAPPEELEAFYSPYPALAKKTTLTKARKMNPGNKKMHTWKELMKERAGVFYVKSFEKVCELARLDQKAVEAFAGSGAARGWVLGRRGRNELNATVDAEVLHPAGAEDDAVFGLAAAAGLEVVGCAVLRQEESSEENLLLTAQEVAFAAECQLEAMRRADSDERPVTFATVVLANSASGLRTEAFEASELAVQMAAEKVLAPAAAQPEDPKAFVATLEPVVVDRVDVAEVDPRFLYRAVGVGALPAKPVLASAFVASAAATEFAGAASKAKKTKALRAHLFAGGKPSKKKLAGRVLDFGFLVAAKGRLSSSDYAAVAAVAKERRADPKAPLPAALQAAVEAAFVGGDEE